MAMTDYYANKVIDDELRSATRYLALFTTATGDGGTGTEVSGGSYARQAVVLSAASSRATTNSSAVTYTQSTASWGTVTHAALYDAVSGGNMLWHGALTSSVAVGDATVFSVPIGDLDVTLTASA